VTFAVGITNPLDTVTDWSVLSAGLILPEMLSPKYPDKAVQLTDKRYLYDLGPVGRLLPGAWETRLVALPYGSVDYNQPVEAELRIFTPSGPVSTTFSLKFV
jgi:hypothetical protein